MSDKDDRKTKTTADEDNAKPPKSAIDSQIDVTSANFDPLKALYAPKLKIPIKNAKLYDNVHTYESSLNEKNRKKSETSVRDSTASTSSKAAATSSKSFNSQDIERRFLPHQGLVTVSRDKARHSRNIFKRFEKDTEGPLSGLKKFMDNKVRVKVYTRTENGLLGYVTGLIQLYDKHWNIVLTDVFEVWKRRKTHYCHAADYGSTATEDECTRLLKKLKIRLPKMTVKSLNRKYIECSRKINQLLIRGEQIALITADKEAETDETVSSQNQSDNL